MSRPVAEQMYFMGEFRKEAVFEIPGKGVKFHSYLGIGGSLVRSMWRTLDSRDVVDLRLFTLEAVDDTERSK